jgi:hypothetical protein
MQTGFAHLIDDIGVLGPKISGGDISVSNQERTGHIPYLQLRRLKDERLPIESK